MSRFAELPDGRRLEFPDDTSDEVIQATIKRILGVEERPLGASGAIQELPAESLAEEPTPGAGIAASRRAAGQALLGIPEAALELATGGLATAAGGVAAIPVTAFEAARGGLARNFPSLGITGGEDPAGAGRAVIERFQELGTFEPISEAGKITSAAIKVPLEKLEEFADIAGEVTGDPNDVLGATLVKTAIWGAPALFGLRRGPVVSKPSPKPTPRRQIAESAAEEGYVTPASVRGEAGLPGLAEGLGGKIKTGQQAIEINQKTTNRLANRAVGLPDEIPMSVEILQGIRAEAGQAFEAIRETGRVFTDNRFQRDLSGAVKQFKNAARDFPELAKNEIINLVDSLRVAEFDAGAGIDAMSLLRNKADVAFRGGDKTLGRSYRAASAAIEGVLERHLARGGDVGVLDSFKQARQQIAETYSVEEALQGRITGEVNATNLATQLKKGKPLTGDLRTIADFANTFPSVSRLFIGTAQAFSPLDLIGGAIGGTGAIIGGAAGLGPISVLPLAAVIARPLLRRGALRKLGKQAAEQIRVAPGVVPGAVVSGIAAQPGEQ